MTKFDALGSASIPTRLRQPASLSSSSFSSTATHRKRSYTLALDAVPEAEAQDSPQKQKLKLSTVEMEAKKVQTMPVPVTVPMSMSKGRVVSLAASESASTSTSSMHDSPMKFDVALARAAPCLLDQSWGDEACDMDVSAVVERMEDGEEVEEVEGMLGGGLGLGLGPGLSGSVNGKRRESVVGISSLGASANSNSRMVLGDKENVPV